MNAGDSRAVARSTPLLCVGHSHLAALQRAAQASAGRPLQAINFWEHPGAVLHTAAGIRFAPGIEASVRAHRGLLVSLLGGAAHNVLGMVAHPRRFDFVLPTQPTLDFDTQAECLPYQAVRALLSVQVEPYLQQMARLRALSTVPMIHLAPPPPSADQQRLARDIPWALYPQATHEVAPAALRLKLWHLHVELLDQWCAGQGVEFLRCPAQACNEDGFLRDDCYGDGAHANAHYGQQVLAQLEAYS
jgi:hypothetical protein